MSEEIAHMNEIIIRVVNVHCFTSMGNGSISLAQIGSMPHRTEARGKPEMPSNRLPIVSFFVDCVISSPFHLIAAAMVRVVLTAACAV